MPVRTGGTAPYAPGETILQAITAFRERGLTTPITEDVLIRASIPESLAKRTLRSLQGLDLLDATGNPTAEFEGLRRVPTTEFKQRLEALIRSVYAEVFQFTDPAKDDPDRVADAFRMYDPPGQRSRMVALFLRLCAASGIIPEQQAKPRTAPAGKRKSPRESSVRINSTKSAAPRARDARAGPSDALGMNADLPPALVGLIASIPVHRGWTAGDRAKFMTAFGHVLDFTVPIVSAVAVPDDGDESNEDDDA